MISGYFYFQEELFYIIDEIHKLHRGTVFEQPASRLPTHVFLLNSLSYKGSVMRNKDSKIATEWNLCIAMSFAPSCTSLPSI